VNLLETVGRYRAVFVADLERETSHGARLAEDLASLERQGLLERQPLCRLDPDEQAEVVSVTEAGCTLLDDHRDGEQDVGQQYYGGWVKPRELWHDAALYHLVRDVEVELEASGASITRVVLDDELKARAFAELQRCRDEEGLSDEEAHGRVASVQHLYLRDDHFVLPDVRLEIEDADGRRRTMDLELVTEHYRERALGGKARAGFRMFQGGGSRAKGGTPWKPGRYLP
jgi:DNA-binding MarR family transcriptional regulator